MRVPFYRYLLSLSICLLVGYGPNAMAQFLVTGGGLNQDEALDIASDAAGNSYVTGYFGSTLNFESGVTLGSSGLSDVFLLKADNTGQVLWAVKGGGTSDERANAVCVDGTGNIYITGYFQGTTNFSGTPITSSGAQDIFVAKYNNAGVLQWVRRAGGTGADLGTGIAVDNAGNVIVTGEFRNTADFGAVNLTAAATDAFVCKYDASGTVLWAKKGDGPDNSRGMDVAVDATGNIYAMGQFSNDITWDVLQTNNIFNAIYLVKFNGAGSEQWFRKIGGATNNIGYSVDVDAGNNVYITGDFTGNLVFFPNTGSPLTNPYPNRIFVAKYNSAGNLEWSRADGSDSELSSRRVTIGPNGEVYLGGWFRCVLSEYSDAYGEGTFNSVGFKDGFIARYDAGGNWVWARNFGGRQDDYVTGVAPGAGDLPLVSAAYVGNLFVQSVYNTYDYDEDEIVDSLVDGASTYCGDNSYNAYLYAETTGGSDFAFGNMVNLNRKPYDYYLRLTSGCDLEQIDVCIAQFGLNCPDSIEFCGSGPLYAQSWTNQAGPNFTYSWSNSQTTSSILVGATGTYSVTQTSADGCFVTTDDIYVTINSLPPVPPISDNVVVNNHAVNTTAIEVCYPDSVILTGHTLGMDNYQWFGPNGAYPPNDSVITVSAIGLNSMIFSVSDENGCFRSNSVQVNILPELPLLDPQIFCYTDPDGNDSVSFCAGGQLQFGFFDSLANTLLACDLFTLAAEITINDQVLATPTFCVTTGPALYSFMVDSSGWYKFEVVISQYNLCDTIEYYTEDSIYVDLYPLPPVDVELSGFNYLCPNDTLFLTATSTHPFTWSGDIAFFPDSLTAGVTMPGLVQISATVMDPNTGCENTDSDTINVQAIIPPTIFPDPGNGVICPNDSLLLTVGDPQFFNQFEWIGPQGSLGVNDSSIYVTEPGFYSVIATSAGGCSQQSNSVEVIQFGTPYLMAPASSQLCPGPDTVIVYVIAGPGSTIQWNAPLSGSDTVQIITSPGNYSVEVNSCGITTTASIEVTVSTLSAEVTTTEGLVFCDGDSVTLEYTAVNAVSHVWNPGAYTGEDYTVYESGSYTVTVEDSAGCTFTSEAVPVSATPDNIPPPEVQDTAFCPAAALTLYATGQGMVYWYADQAAAALDSGNVYQTPTLESPTVYYVQAKFGGCVSDFAPINLTEANCDELIMPNIFTPNGDGNNDLVVFDIKGTTCFYAEIRNRWGVKVFQSENPQSSWDGSSLQTGLKVVDGTYFYIVDYCPQDSGKKTIKGFITVVSK